MRAAPRADPRRRPRALVVVDASVFGALVFNESRSGEAADLLTARTLAAPGLVHYEMANIARTKMLRNPGTGDLLSRAFRRWLDLPVNLLTPDFADVLAIATTEGISAYDAAYICVARDLRAPLLTFDERLAAVWERSGA
ncbi:MAG: hypothetical protein Kow00122_08900 [Thermoleophilia bacterium]